VSDRDYSYGRFAALVERARRELEKRGALPQSPLPPDWDLMPLPRLWHALNDQKRQGAAQSTYDAVLWVLRTYGVARLADDWMPPRLAQFSPEQLAELIAAMRRLKASGKWPNVTDELIAKLEALT
jgi:hypothetical protein